MYGLTEVKLNTASHELIVGDRVCRCDMVVVDGVKVAAEVLRGITEPRRDVLLHFSREGDIVIIHQFQVVKDGEVVPEMVLDAARTLEEKPKESNG